MRVRDADIDCASMAISVRRGRAMIVDDVIDIELIESIDWLSRN